MALVKICGLTSVADALAAAETGADWLGLNFHPPSPRYLDEQTACSIVAALPQNIEVVGLFVDRPTREILAIAKRVGLHIVQLHGDEPIEAIRELQNAGLQVVRAFRLADNAAITLMTDWLKAVEQLGAAPMAVLVDAYHPSMRGGTGQAIPDDLLGLLPASIRGRLILAGGLTPENVAERVRTNQPWMVDTASGVESAPGKKDTSRMASFIRAAKQA